MAALKRYWPVLVVAAVVAAALGFGAVGDDDDDDVAAPAGDGPAARADGPPALLAFEGEDPLGAPDCDRETGQLMIPSVYAPMCVPLWDESRDNGGATYPGVTSDEIKIVVYDAEGNEEIEAGIEDALGRELTEAEENAANRVKVFEAFNALYETYGRTVTFEMLAASGSATDDAAAKADAIRAAEEMGAFAVLGGPTGTKAFAEELVARKVLCIGCAESYPAETYQEWAPYVWSVLMSSTYRATYAADLVKSLAGKPAIHAGDAFQDTTRKFAFVHGDTIDNAYAAAAASFLADVRAADIEVSDHPYLFDIGTAQEAAGTLVARLKSDGVTSVILAGDPFMPYFLTQEATGQDWFPEWVLSGSVGSDLAIAGRSYDQQQWRHAFGISMLTARVDPAVTEQEEENLIAWYLGERLSTYPEEFSGGVLFAGIHGAGPNLTPETFRDALFAGAPLGGFVTRAGISLGDAVWGEPDYTITDDVTLLWWDPEAVGPHEDQDAGESGTGMYRYVDSGKRYMPGELEGVEPAFFEEAGSELLFDARPESDIPPSYPRRTSRTG